MAPTTSPCNISISERLSQHVKTQATIPATRLSYRGMARWKVSICHHPRSGQNFTRVLECILPFRVAARFQGGRSQTNKILPTTVNKEWSSHFPYSLLHPQLKTEPRSCTHPAKELFYYNSPAGQRAWASPCFLTLERMNAGFADARRPMQVHERRARVILKQ